MTLAKASEAVREATGTHAHIRYDLAKRCQVCREAMEAVRALEAHLVKAHESEDRATQAAERAEVRLAEAELLIRLLHHINEEEGSHLSGCPYCDFVLSSPAGRDSGPEDARLSNRSSSGVAKAAANSGGDHKEAAR